METCPLLPDASGGNFWRNFAKTYIKSKMNQHLFSKSSLARVKRYIEPSETVSW